MSNNSESEMLEKIKTILDESTEDIDAATLSKIRQARYRALDGLGPRKNRQWWIPASVGVTACMGLLIFSMLTRVPEQAEPILDDLDLLSTIDELEFYEQLEFYEWLEDYALPT